MSVSKLNQFDSPTGPSSASDTRKSEQSTRVFYSAVVLDFISNPAEYMEKTVDDWPESGLPGVSTSELSSAEISELEGGTISSALLSNGSDISNASISLKIPRNTIIGQTTSDGMSKKGKPEIFYPFFSPHLCMPVNAGEQVWVIYESAGATRSIGYWICRRPTDLQVDDLNYTHADRDTLGLAISGEDRSAMATFEGADESLPDPFSFPLGGGGNTSANTLQGYSPYNDIIEKSLAYQNQFVGESVPRFSKRSADLVFQGSNNTLISLGQDRGFSPDEEGGGVDEIDPTVGGSAITGAGTIDIVAGRGQEGSISAVSATGDAIRGLLEDIEYEETDKAPEITGTASNINEGDPDFLNDLSRIYVSMLTNADENFGIEIEGIDATEEGPAIVVKSSQVRLLARDDIKIHVGEAETGASVVIKSTGDIVFIPGPDGVIKLGGEDADLALLTSGNPATTGGDGVGEVTAAPISTTWGGLVGVEGSLGSFASKILVK